MTARPQTNPPDDMDLRAAEYVLGVTDIAQRQAVEAEARTNPALAARIAAWEAHFAGMNGDFAEAPLPDLLPQIEARLFPKAPAPRREPFWRRSFGLGAGLAAILVAGWLSFIPQKPDLVATLAAQPGQAVAFQAAAVGDTLTVAMVTGEGPGEGRDFELWIIRGNAAPVSLGVLPADGERLTLPAEAEGAVLAVSLEPKGGSTTGAPTGPILALGPLTRA